MSDARNSLPAGGGNADYRQQIGGLITQAPSYPGNILTPPLKALVAEYLMDFYRADPELFPDAFRHLTEFLAWEEKRRKGPAVTMIPPPPIPWDTNATVHKYVPGQLYYEGKEGT